MTELDQLASKVSELLIAARVPDDYWTADQCAEYAHLSVKYFREKVAVKPKFPKPITPGDGGKRIWSAEMVKDYFRREVLRANRAS